MYVASCVNNIYNIYITDTGDPVTMKLRKRLAFQLSFRFALLIVVAFALVYISFYFIMTQAMVRERSSLLRQRLDVIVEGLDNRVDSVLSLQTDMLHDDTLQSSLKNPGGSLSISRS